MIYDVSLLCDFFSSTIYLYCSNDPVIEASNGLKFGPFNVGYQGLKLQAETAGLTTVNKWELIFDFSANDTSNHSQIPPEQWSTKLLQIPDGGNAEPPSDEPEFYFDFPNRYGG